MVFEGQKLCGLSVTLVAAPCVAATPHDEVLAMQQCGALAQGVEMGEDVDVGLAHKLTAQRLVAFGSGGEETLDVVAVGHDKFYELIVVRVGGEVIVRLCDCVNVVC